MPSIIYQLDTPLNHGGMRYQYLNIFRIDMETKRENAIFEPHLSMYVAACEANGTELKTYNEQGREIPIGSSFMRLKINEVTPDQKTAHRNLMQSLYEYLQADNVLGSGSIVEAVE